MWHDHDRLDLCSDGVTIRSPTTQPLPTLHGRHGRAVRRREQEVSRPVGRPRRQRQDALAVGVRLQQHGRQGHAQFVAMLDIGTAVAAVNECQDKILLLALRHLTK